MAIKSPFHILDDPFLDIWSIDLAPPAPIGMAVIQDPDVVVGPPIDSPSLPSIQDPHIVVIPPVEPPRDQVPIQQPASNSFTPLPASAFQDSAAPIDGLTGHQQAPGAMPPIQDPDVVVPPPDLGPTGGPPVQDPNIVVAPPIEPPLTHAPVQDPDFLSAALPGHELLQGAGDPGMSDRLIHAQAALPLPMAAPDWWL